MFRQQPFVEYLSFFDLTCTVTRLTLVSAQ